eukprot:3656404-Prymnesium_polylepis.1
MPRPATRRAAARCVRARRACSAARQRTTRRASMRGACRLTTRSSCRCFASSRASPAWSGPPSCARTSSCSAPRRASSRFLRSPAEACRGAPRGPARAHALGTADWRRCTPHAKASCRLAG